MTHYTGTHTGRRNPLQANGMRYPEFLDHTRLPASEREIFDENLARRRDQMFPPDTHRAMKTIAPSAIEPRGHPPVWNEGLQHPANSGRWQARRRRNY